MQVTKEKPNKSHPHTP